MKLALALIAALVLPFQATAQALQPFPQAYSVTGVAADDVLNIRAAPNARAPIIGELRPFAVSVEVLRLSEDGKWGMVAAGDGMGWTSMHFLKPLDATPAGEVPRPLRCFGTEPFWSLGMFARGNRFELPGEGRRDLTLLREAVSYRGYGLMFQDGPALRRTLTIERGYCDDGMSEREYGFRAILFNTGPEDNSLLFGCCTLDNR